MKMKYIRSLKPSPQSNCNGYVKPSNHRLSQYPGEETRNLGHLDPLVTKLSNRFLELGDVDSLEAYQLQTQNLTGPSPRSW